MPEKKDYTKVVVLGSWSMKFTLIGMEESVRRSGLFVPYVLWVVVELLGLKHLSGDREEAAGYMDLECEG